MSTARIVATRRSVSSRAICSGESRKASFTARIMSRSAAASAAASNPGTGTRLIPAESAARRRTARRASSTARSSASAAASPEVSLLSMAKPLSPYNSQTSQRITPRRARHDPMGAPPDQA